MRDGEIPAGAKVRVYRNLTRGVFSVLYQGRVIAHRERIVLERVSFVVQPGGKRRAQRTKVRNVHAFVCGYIAQADVSAEIPVTYNPFLSKGFYNRNSGQEVVGAERAIMDTKLGVVVANPLYSNAR